MKDLIISYIPGPKDLNNGGTVFGGWTLSFLDTAASDFAFRKVGGRLVTHKIDNLVFLKPIFSGDKVSAYVTSCQINESEVEAHIEIYAERVSNVFEEVLVLVADVTGVAVDEEGKRRTIN